MADNVILQTMSGGDTVAADDIGGIKVQRIKIIHGADGVNDGDVSTANGLPVALLASTAAIGKLAANSGVDIGDVDILSIAAGDNNIGNVDIVTVPADPFGVNADAASATGSISAKLRFLAASGIAGMTTLPAGTNAIGKLAANSGVDIGDTDVTSIVPGSGATNLGKAEDAAHTSGDIGIMALSVGNEAQSTLAADGDYIPQAVDTKGNSMTVGNIAHDGVDAGNPVKIGYKAIAHGANPTAVAAADRVNGLASRAGIPWVIGGHPNVVTLEAAYTAAQTDAAVITVGAGAIIVVTQIQVVCDNANTVDVGVRVGFGTANTPTTTGVVGTHPGIAPGSGFIRGDGSGIIGIGADNEDLRITCEVPTGGSIRVLVSYYTIES